MAVGAVGVWAVSHFSGDAKVVNSRFVTKTTDTGNIARSVSASGAVRPLITVEIGSQLSGQVEAMFADYNDEVEEGELLTEVVDIENLDEVAEEAAEEALDELAALAEQLAAVQPAAGEARGASNSGYGLGIGVKLKNEEYLSEGSVYWAGKGGTFFLIDPKESLAVVGMMQVFGVNRLLEKKLIPWIYDWVRIQH